MHNIKLEDITNKYPFIYEVQDKFYIIGRSTFAVCSSRFAIEYFRLYREEIKKLGRLYIQERHYDNKSDFNSLVYYFRKVKAYANIDLPNEEKVKAKERIYEFLDKLKLEERQSLLEQVEDYVASFWYFNRLF